MKTHIHSHRESGVALIIVLAMLVLLSGLIVSFMTAVGNERAASFISNNEVTSRQIADSTVNLVISQIREATSQSTAEVPTTWASQPGAIRTFSGTVGGLKNVTNGPTSAGTVKQAVYRGGNNDFVFKLYSAENMKVAPSTFANKPWDQKEVDVINNWSWSLSEKEREESFSLFGYVDLNDPIVAPMPESLTKGDPQIVEPRYPIIDPRAKYDKDENANATAEPGIVDGFDIKTLNMTDPKLKFIPKNSAGTRGKGTPQKVPYLPMPVKWLYVMRDGTMAAAEDANGGRIPGAGADNPIIGRTAFWTDDDSCRLNINTASEGTFWETPTASSEQESGNITDAGVITSSAISLSLASAQPARGEYQRYPGHPATTCLSPALGWMFGTGNTLSEHLPTYWPRQPRDPKLIAMKDAIAQMSPFSPWGRKGIIAANDPPNSTSMGGSWCAAPEMINMNPDLPKVVEKDPKLAIGTKHLYSSVDELVFKQERVPTTPPSKNDPTILNNPNIVPESLEKVRFFLTANSRSPELNLFGRPRVTFWPVHADPTQRTAFDDLFAFTSTFYKDVDGDGSTDNTFFFTRSNAKSPTIDYNPKNQAMMTYLKTLTSSAFPIPGFGGSFEQKYGKEETEQILTLIFDYCRCTNLVDTSTRLRSGVPYRPYTPFYGDSAAYNDRSPRSADWSGQVTPLRVGAVSKHQGFGRVPMISEAAIVVHRGNPATKLQATLIMEMSTVMAGFPAIRDTYWMRVTPVERPTRIGDTDIKLVGGVGEARINIVNVGSHDVGYGRAYLPTLGFQSQMCCFVEHAKPTPDGAPLTTGTPAAKTFKKDPSTLDVGAYKQGVTYKYYPFVSDLIDPPAGANMKFTAGCFVVEMFAGESPDDKNPGRNELIQKVELYFPPDQITVKTPAGADRSFDTRIDGRESNTKLGDWNAVFSGIDDVIRSIEFVGAKPTGGGYDTLTGDQRGDLRLGAAMRVIPKEAYAPRGGITAYTASANLRVHGLQVGHSDPYSGYFGTRGLLVPGGVYRTSKPPILPADINGVKNAAGGPGDWDRGLSKHLDGPMGNKVDEGNVQFDIRQTSSNRMPYFLGRSIEETGKSFFSPNRQVSSAVMFGSLPTGSVAGKPWQTLLFRPDRGSISHPGAQQVGKPADHLLLDLFNLPVVEPYAISEPFSSGGKVNLNYVIAPFGYANGDSGKRKSNNKDRSYLRRDTALRGIFKAVKIMCVPTEQPSSGHNENAFEVSLPFRFDIDAERTLDQFEDRLKDPERGLFRSASEICDMDLYPFDPKVTPGTIAPGSATPVTPVTAAKPLTDWGKFWDQYYAQTGDNMRERPYSHIYPRVTTKSNVFTVYMRCQAVKKVAGTPPDKFDPKKDKVIGAYRGSATIERFIDPNDKELKDYRPTDQNSSVDKFYRFRVLNTKQFLPR